MWHGVSPVVRGPRGSFVPSFFLSSLSVLVTWNKWSQAWCLDTISYISGGQKPQISFTGPKVWCQQGHAPSRGSRREVSLLFLLLELHSMCSVAHSPLPHFQHLEHGIFKFISLSTELSSLPPFLHPSCPLTLLYFLYFLPSTNSACLPCARWCSWLLCRVLYSHKIKYMWSYAIIAISLRCKCDYYTSRYSHFSSKW